MTDTPPRHLSTTLVPSRWPLLYLPISASRAWLSAVCHLPATPSPHQLPLESRPLPCWNAALRMKAKWFDTASGLVTLAGPGPWPVRPGPFQLCLALPTPECCHLLLQQQALCFLQHIQ